MGYIIINKDKEDELSGMRTRMRRSMRSNYRYEDMPRMRHEDYDPDKMYETGFRHGWEDAEEEHYRRQRDSRGRYI